MTPQFSQSIPCAKALLLPRPAFSLLLGAIVVALAGCAAGDKSISKAQNASVAPPAAQTADAPQANVQSSISFVYEDRLKDEDIFLDWLEVKVDGEASVDSPAKDFALGPHVVKVEARFGKVGDDAGIIFKKSIVVVVQPSRLTSVHLVVRDLAAAKLAAQVAPELMVKVYDQTSTRTAAVPLISDGTSPKERKLVPIAMPAKVKLMDNKFNVVEVCVTEAGAVNFQTLVEPLHPSFDAIALDRIARSVFKPLVQEGKPVPFCFLQKNVARQP